MRTRQPRMATLYPCCDAGLFLDDREIGGEGPRVRDSDASRLRMNPNRFRTVRLERFQSAGFRRRRKARALAGRLLARLKSALYIQKTKVPRTSAWAKFLAPFGTQKPFLAALRAG